MTSSSFLLLLLYLCSLKGGEMGKEYVIKVQMVNNNFFCLGTIIFMMILFLFTVMTCRGTKSSLLYGCLCSNGLFLKNIQFPVNLQTNCFRSEIRSLTSFVHVSCMDRYEG